MGTVLVSLLVNVVSSVGVIFINKRMVFIGANFPFGTVLTIIHFVVTFLGCLFFAKLRLFEIKKMEILRVLPICFAFCGYVVFNNLSLLTNSVSVYQTSKILCTPIIVAIEYVAYRKREKRSTLISLFPVCIGVAITVYTDSEVNLVGSVWATLAIVSNSFYTIWGKTKQSELNVTAMQILTYQAPISAAMLMLAIPLDGLSALASYRMTSYSLLAIGTSCIFAFGVNFSFFLFVGQTSPLTMNVVGYLKTCLVFIGGFLFLDTVATVQNVLGVVITMAGLALYTASKIVPAPHSPDSKA
jgi:solute carrier family 35 protein E3